MGQNFTLHTFTVLFSAIQCPSTIALSSQLAADYSQLGVSAMWLGSYDYCKSLGVVVSDCAVFDQSRHLGSLSTAYQVVYKGPL